jgi:hypothetical protein
MNFVGVGERLLPWFVATLPNLDGKVEVGKLLKVSSWIKVSAALAKVPQFSQEIFKSS